MIELKKTWRAYPGRSIKTHVVQSDVCQELGGQTSLPLGSDKLIIGVTYQARFVMKHQERMSYMAETNIPIFYLDSYTKGRVTPLNVSDYPTLGKLLEAENISMANAVIMFKDKNGNAKAVAAGTAIEENDEIDIQNASNKSGK